MTFVLQRTPYGKWEDNFENRRVTWKSFSHVQLCNPTYYTVHGILQAWILQWGAFLFSRGSSQPRDWTQISHTAGRFFTSWATRKALSLSLSLYSTRNSTQYSVMTYMGKTSKNSVDIFITYSLAVPQKWPQQNQLYSTTFFLKVKILKNLKN